MCRNIGRFADVLCAQRSPTRTESTLADRALPHRRVSEVAVVQTADTAVQRQLSAAVEKRAWPADFQTIPAGH